MQSIQQAIQQKKIVDCKKLSLTAMKAQLRYEREFNRKLLNALKNETHVHVHTVRQVCSGLVDQDMY